MTSELRANINEIIDFECKLKGKITELKDEYDELTDVTLAHSFKENRRARKIKKELDELQSVNLSFEPDFNSFINKVNEYNTLVSSPADATILAEKMGEISEKVEKIQNKYQSYIDKIIYGGEEIKEGKINKKVVGVTAVAALIALGLIVPKMAKTFSNNNNTFGNSSTINNNNNNNNNNKWQNDTTNPTKPSEEEPERVNIPELDQYSTFTQVENEEDITKVASELMVLLDAVAPDNNYTEQNVIDYLKEKNGFTSSENIGSAPDKDGNEPSNEVLEFTDIHDEEQVTNRAIIINEYFNKISPNQNMTVEKVEEFLKYINSGIVDEPSYDGAAFVIDSINDLMVNELAAASDIINEVETGREKKEVLVDYSIFFLDGSQGQRLGKKINDLRQSMIINASGDISNYKKQFTELFLNSWILHGFNGAEINSYLLETPGMEALIDVMFLNTSILVGESKDMIVTNPLTLEEVSLKEIHEIANYEDCPTQLMDENGIVLDEKITLDKSSSDLYAMYTKAMMNKINNEEINRRTLNS